MRRKRRVLFVCEAVTLAHVARSLVLAKESRDCLDIIFAVASSVRDLVVREGWKVEVIKSVSSIEFMRRLRWGECVFRAQELCDNVYEDLELMRRMRPDVVVGDFRLSLSISCRLAGIPYIALGNAYWHPDANLHTPVPELLLTKVFGVRLAQWIFDRLAPTIMAGHVKIFNRVRNDFGLPSLMEGLWKIYLDADLLALADLPQCYPDVQESSHLRFIGPCIWEPPVLLPEWWDSISCDEPVIFLCMGSSGQASVIEDVLDGCLAQGWTVMLASVDRNSNRSHKSLKNLYVANFLPGLAAMQRSNILICNGGSPMCQLAMSCGKPVIGIPSNLDQFLNMAMVVRNGLGFELRPEKLRSTDVSHALTNIDARAGADAGVLATIAGQCSLWKEHPPRIAHLVDEITT